MLSNKTQMQPLLMDLYDWSADHTFYNSSGPNQSAWNRWWSISSLVRIKRVDQRCPSKLNIQIVDVDCLHGC